MLSEKIIKDTIKLNKDFYKAHQEEFSKTRHNSWLGWKRVTEVIGAEMPQKNMSVLDLGCGNGRFYAHLTSHLEKDFTYLGLDTNDYMLVEALLKYEETDFKSFDVVTNLEKIESKYNVVVAFGLTHHLPGTEFRASWFTQAANLVDKDGIFIFTNWQLDKDGRSEKLEPAKDLENNDFYYGWNDSDDKRYVHIYDKAEFSEITKTLEQNGMKLLEAFENDGKTEKLNKYYVFKQFS